MIAAKACITCKFTYASYTPGITQVSPLMFFRVALAALPEAWKPATVVSALCACLQVGQPILVTEYLENGDLYKAINSQQGNRYHWYRMQVDGKPLPNSGMGRRVALDVARGLHFLHTRKIVHFVSPMTHQSASFTTYEARGEDSLLCGSSAAQCQPLRAISGAVSSLIQRIYLMWGNYSQNNPQHIERFGLETLSSVIPHLFARRAGKVGRQLSLRLSAHSQDTL